MGEVIISKQNELKQVRSEMNSGFWAILVVNFFALMLGFAWPGTQKILLLQFCLLSILLGLFIGFLTIIFYYKKRIKGDKLYYKDIFVNFLLRQQTKRNKFLRHIFNVVEMAIIMTVVNIIGHVWGYQPIGYFFVGLVFPTTLFTITILYIWIVIYERKHGPLYEIHEYNPQDVSSFTSV